MTDTRPTRREPIFNAPTIVLVVIAAFVVIHAVREFLLDYDGQTEAIIYFAFIPARLTSAGAAALPGGLPAGIWSMVSHAFLHADWMHLTINGAWLLAFGSLTARRCGVAGFLALYAFAAAAGALAFYVVDPSALVPLVGASGAISGMMGGAFRLLFSTPAGGFAMLHSFPMAVPRMPLALALRDRRTMSAVGIWVAVNLAFGLGLADVFASGQIAWEAHIGGFLFGFLAFSWFDRGAGFGTWGERSH